MALVTEGSLEQETSIKPENRKRRTKYDCSFHNVNCFFNKRFFGLAGWRGVGRKLHREELRTINPGGEDGLDTVVCKF